MKSRLVVAVVVLVVLTSGAWAQALFSPRAAGMGGAGIAVADDGAAWFQNPAGLAALNVPVKEGTEYGNDVIFGFADTDEMSAWGLSWSGWKPSSNMGFGAGFGDVENLGSAFGAGFGVGFKDTPLSAGLNVMALNPDGTVVDESTVLNAGALYRLSLGEGKAPLRVGLTVLDITDEMGGPVWNAGLAWKATSDLLIAVDFNDLSDEGDQGVLVSGGVEYAFGSAKAWRARAGAMDNGDETDFTVGLGYQAKQWRLDAAYLDTEDGVWTFGVGVNL